MFWDATCGDADEGISKVNTDAVDDACDNREDARDLPEKVSSSLHMCIFTLYFKILVMFAIRRVVLFLAYAFWVIDCFSVGDGLGDR